MMLCSCSALLVLAQSSLLLCVLHGLLLHVEALAAAHSVGVLQGLVSRVCFLPEVQVLFFCGGNPVRIAADHLRHRRSREYKANSHSVSFDILLLFGSLTSFSLPGVMCKATRSISYRLRPLRLPLLGNPLRTRAALKHL